MKVTVTAKDSFAHGSKTYVAGDQVEVSVYEARELAANGLTTAHDEGEKAAPAPANKMESAPANKAEDTDDLLGDGAAEVEAEKTTSKAKGKK